MLRMRLVTAAVLSSILMSTTPAIGGAQLGAIRRKAEEAARKKIDEDAKKSADSAKAKPDSAKAKSGIPCAMTSIFAALPPYVLSSSSRPFSAMTTIRDEMTRRRSST